MASFNKAKIIPFALISFCLVAQEPLRTEPVSSPFSVNSNSINKLHLLYLIQSQEIEKAFSLYQDYKKQADKHDFELLQQMALTLLEKGARSQDPFVQLTSLFGCHLAGITASIDILEAGILSSNPETQVAAVQFLGQLQDDRCEELLTKAMSSEFFFTRLEAAHQLAIRKSKTATGQIESLMHKVPPQMRFFFAPLFALIGTQDAISLLKQMMSDPMHTTRIEAILSSARFKRDDLLPGIRNQATHLNAAEQEACAYALGILKDSKSIPTLKTLSESKAEPLQISALYALHTLGDREARKKIDAIAQKKNLFAINLLAEISGYENTLASLMNDEDLQVRFNATVALLRRKDPRACLPLREFLIRDSKDLGFQPQFSSGNSLMAWKVIPSVKYHQKESMYDLAAVSLSVREMLLKESLELPEDSFLHIARSLFSSRQTDLIPTLIHLIENLNSDAASSLLREESQKAGAPLTRAYCNLALFRLEKKEPYKTAILQWLDAKRHTELIRFRPLLPRDLRLSDQATSFELTPEENSQLLIECYETLALVHHEESIDTLINDLKSGNPQNRAILAGLLIQAIQ